jgi:hypothetical protein
MIAVGAALTLIIGHGDLATQSGPPLRIGHYSTGSGLIGFVIDRMGTPSSCASTAPTKSWP